VDAAVRQKWKKIHQRGGILREFWLRETAGTERAAKIIIMYFYVNKYQKKKHVK